MRLDIRNLSFGYKGSRMILKDISTSVCSGNVLGVLGPNGTGKTTFIKCINRILEPSTGEILLGGVNIRNMKHRDIARKIAYVPQYGYSFFPINVIDTVMLGRAPYAVQHYTEEDEKVVFRILQQMQLEKFAFRNIMAMSGGERQRVLIARALAQDPKVIILDEPTSSLDPYNQLFILQTIQALAKNDNLIVVVIIHDLNLAAMYCDRLLMLKDGYVFAQGTPSEVLTSENIRGMYGVNTEITEKDDTPYVRLLKLLPAGSEESLSKKITE